MRKASVLVLAALILAGCAPEPPQQHRVLRDGLMGTVMMITAYGEGAHEAILAAYERIEEIHRAAEMSDPEIYVFHIADGEGMILPHETAEIIRTLLDLSLYVYEGTGTAFDPAIGPIIRLWGIGTEYEAVPSQAEINAALNFSMLSRIYWFDEDALFFGRTGMSLDFGGIAKGYACDEAVRILREHGVEHALLDLGGDIYALGTRPDGNPWRIGLRSPLGDGEVIGILELSDIAVVTSGSYLRYFEQDGQRYHHIFDPLTGRPADSGLLSVTVIYENSALADAFSTAFFVRGLAFSSGIMLQDFSEMSAIFITEELEVHLIGENAQGFRLTDDRFRIAS